MCSITLFFNKKMSFRLEKNGYKTFTDFRIKRNNEVVGSKGEEKITEQQDIKKQTNKKLTKTKKNYETRRNIA